MISEEKPEIIKEKEEDTILEYWHVNGDYVEADFGIPKCDDWRNTLREIK